MAACPTRLNNITDDESILVQFSNCKGKPTGVGFQAWVIKEKFLMNLQTHINKELEVWWPKELDVAPARALKKKLSDCEWQSWVVKLLSVGTYTEMCDQAKNMEKYGMTNPSRQQRRMLCKKMPGDMDEDNSTVDASTLSNSSDESDPSEGQLSLSHKQKVRGLEKKNTHKMKSKETSSHALNEGMLKIMGKKVTVNCLPSSDDEDEDNDGNNNGRFYPSYKTSENALLKRIASLEEENKRLREDNSRLRALRAINKDLKKITQMSSDLLKFFENQRDCQQVQLTHSSNSNSSRPTNLVGPGPRQTLKLSPPVKPSRSVVGIAVQDEEKTNFGGREVKTVLVHRIDKGKDIKSYATALTSIVFSEEELATSSLTGEKANTTEKQSAKKMLDKSVVEAIIDYVLKLYAGAMENRGKGVSAVRAAIRAKCNNAAAKMKKKAPLLLHNEEPHSKIEKPEEEDREA